MPRNMTSSELAKCLKGKAVVEKQAPKQSHLVTKLLERWDEIGGPPLVLEFPFAESVGRKFRLDAANLQSKVGIETHGGIWAGGRHTRGGGFETDREKMNLAITLGWVVYELTEKMLEVDQLKVIAKTMEGRMA